MSHMKKSYFLLAFIYLFGISVSNAQEKKVLFEEFTSTTCAPCFSFNIILKSFIDSKGDSIVAIKYHGVEGGDPMFRAEARQRLSEYYSDIYGLPWLKVDGSLFSRFWPVIKFDTAFNTRKAVKPLITINIVDVRISPDSISSTVNIHVLQNLPSGDYKLRVMAVEKEIIYPTAPGSNYEREFENVFRRSFPDMTGTVIPTAAGEYEFNFRYKLESEWTENKIYTVAFVQNDASNKEVLNCAKGNLTTGSGFRSEIVIPETLLPEKFSLYQNYPNPFNPVTKIKFDIPSNVKGQTSDVKLIIYDALGKEVTKLVNEKLDAGSYEAEFNGSSYSSGIYFYKLEAGNFSEVKRMILLK